MLSVLHARPEHRPDLRSQQPNDSTDSACMQLVETITFDEGSDSSTRESKAILVFAPGRSLLADFLLRSNIPMRDVYNREIGFMIASEHALATHSYP